jgi:hypothetical protein
MLGVNYYGYVDGSVLLSFSYSSFAYEFNYVQKFLSIVTAAANECDPVVSPKTRRRLGSPSHEQQPRTSYHRVDAGHCIAKR